MEKRSSSLISFLSSIDYSFIPYLSHSLLHVSPHCPRLTKRKGRDGRETQRREGKGEWVRHEDPFTSRPFTSFTPYLFVPQLSSPHILSSRSNAGKWRGEVGFLHIPNPRFLAGAWVRGRDGSMIGKEEEGNHVHSQIHSLLWNTWQGKKRVNGSVPLLSISCNSPLPAINAGG